MIRDTVAPDSAAGGSRLGGLLAACAGAGLVVLWAAAIDGGDRLSLLLDGALGCGLLALAWIDWQQMRLPDVLTLPLLALGLMATALTTPQDLASSIVGAAAGYAAIRLIDGGYRALRGRSGLGQGDAKLLAAGGAWLGWEALPRVALLAALLGLALAVVRHARGVALTRETAVPFGPPLALAIWIARVHGFPPF